MEEELKSRLDKVESELICVEQQLEQILQRQQSLQERKEMLIAQLESFKASVDLETKQATDWEKGQFPWSEKVKETLLSVFKITSFRPLQASCVNATLSLRDAILIMPTGGGKSLCYQLPALLSPGITLVVSPLVSLMEDQLMSVKSLAINASLLNASTSRTEATQIQNSMTDKQSGLKLLYVTPEKIAKSKRFMSKLEKTYELGLLSRIVIDEIHCASQWGHDFRPDYKILGILKNQFPQTPILGLTATATSKILTDVKEMLLLKQCLIFRASYNRSNLFYEVRVKPAAHKTQIDEIADLIKTRFSMQSGIVYCLSRKDSERVCLDLCGKGISAGCYHADLPPDERSGVHRKWLNKNVQVIVATVAFGMGIDKPDVRFVIHHTISKSIENYYQESGRAGRDGSTAHCIVYFRATDVFRQSTMVFTEHTATEAPGTNVSTTSFKESSTDPFTASTKEPSNLSTTHGIFTTITEALATTEAPLNNETSEEEVTTTQGEPITTPNDEGPTTTNRGEPITTLNDEGPTTTNHRELTTTPNDEGPTTTREEEPVTSTAEGKTTTFVEGASTSEGGTTMANIEGATNQPTLETVSEKISTTINSESATDSTPSDTTPASITTTTTMDTPTDPAPTTAPPPPVLDVMTNGDMFTVMHGSSLTLQCHVTGGGAGTTLSWYLNGTKLPDDVGVAQPNVDQHGIARLSSYLTFDLVELSHAGVYECVAHSPVDSLTVRAPIQVIVKPLLRAPVNLTLVGSGGGRLVISWTPNPLNSDQQIGGYKVTWDVPSRLIKSARGAVSPAKTQYTTDPVDLSVVYGVLVWAYSHLGDGEPAKADWTPESTVPTMATEDIDRTECIAIATSPTRVLLEWPEQVGVSNDVTNIVATCQASQTSSITPVSTATNSYRLRNLLPSCHYHIRVGVANCYVDTPRGNVSLSARVHRHDNGSIQLDWTLPEELRGEAATERLIIEVRVGGANGGWVSIEPGHTPHIPAHLLSIEHTIDFRLRLGNWEGHSLVIVPPQTTTTIAMATDEPESAGSGFQFSEIGLIYGLVFGVMVVACASVVIVILVLKYIQMNRREDDKATNHREKHMEEFRRLSLKRSSVNSLKKDPNYYQPRKV